MAIPKYTKGKLALVPKNKEGQPLESKVEALDDPRSGTPDLLPPPGTTDRPASPLGRKKALSGRSRNGRRSWITSAACR